MRAQPGARAFKSGRQVQAPAAFEAGRRVLPPAALVEVDGQEPAGVVRQQRIDAGHERLAAGIGARQVPAHDLVRQGKKPTVRAFGAFDPGLLAHAADPFVRTGGRIAVLARPAALEPARIDVLAAAEQRAEQPDLGVRWRLAIDGRAGVHRPPVGTAAPRSNRSHRDATLPLLTSLHKKSVLAAVSARCAFETTADPQPAYRPPPPHRTSAPFPALIRPAMWLRFVDCSDGAARRVRHCVSTKS